MSSNPQIYIVRKHEQRALIPALNSFASGPSGAWISINHEDIFTGYNHWTNLTERSSNPWFSFRFTGTAFSLFGPYQGGGPKPTFQVELDGDSPLTASPLARSFQDRWYESPTKPEGEHSVNITQILDPALKTDPAFKNSFVALDYAVITPGPNTPLSTEILMVDDTHPDVTYAGSRWIREDLTRFPNWRPFFNGTHRTDNRGDTLLFSFAGTQVQAYGIRHEAKTTIIYSVDGDTPTRTEIAGSSKDQANTPNNLLLNVPNLTAGNHTLNITFMEGGMLELDYLLYRPSFTTLATIPLRNTSTSGDPQPSSSPQPTPTPSPNRSAGPIAGGVVGGIAFIAILAAAFWFLRRRKARAPPEASIAPIQPSMSESYQVTPFIAPRSQTTVVTDSSVTGRPSESADTSATPYLQPRPAKSQTNLQPVRRGEQESQVELLRRQVDRLEEENARLAAERASPPAYSVAGHDRP